ncbi:MAG TPA: Flp family type IVb pilin [Syntrophales bacterium]|jgi:pilus assembly protein Flp/PilA|nr:Flp family type IVb pilin [Syntrophales bacterium]HRT60882.1 Flp family type IVb pilin [Syntrophales bacterium]
MLREIVALARSEEGVTSVEYALIALLVALVIVVGVAALGQRLDVMYRSIAGAFIR